MKDVVNKDCLPVMLEVNRIRKALDKDAAKRVKPNWIMQRMAGYQRESGLKTA